MTRLAAILIAFLALLPSCCRKSVVSSSRSDSVRVERRTEYIETLRDTVIFLSVPVESRAAVRPDSSVLETSVARSVARVGADGSLFHTLDNIPVALPVTAQVRDTRRLERSDSVRAERSAVTTVVRERYVPALYKVCFWIVAALGAWLIIKNAKRLRSIIF